RQRIAKYEPAEARVRAGAKDSPGGIPRVANGCLQKRAAAARDRWLAACGRPAPPPVVAKSSGPPTSNAAAHKPWPSRPTHGPARKQQACRPAPADRHLLRQQILHPVRGAAPTLQELVP